MNVDQALIDQIVWNVLAQLQPAPARPVIDEPKPQPRPQTQPSVIEVSAKIITAELLSSVVRSGQPMKFGRKSILTPSARDYLHSKKILWSRGDINPVAASKAKEHARWQLIIQSVTPGVRALQDAMKRHPEGWRLELVGKSVEAAALATNMLGTAEYDGVAVLSEFAEIIVCRANRNEKVRAAVISDRKQLEQTRQHLGVNLVCINPHGRTFIEMRNLLRDCAAAKPTAPVGWN